MISIDYLGEDVTDVDTANANRGCVPCTARRARYPRRAVGSGAAAGGIAESCRRWARRCPATARRSRWRTPTPSVSVRSASGRGDVDAEDHTTDGTRHSRSCASCVPTSTGWARFCSPTSSAPVPTARSSRRRLRGSGCARGLRRTRIDDFRRRARRPWIGPYRHRTRRQVRYESVTSSGREGHRTAGSS